jgi:calcium-translocating P-type ATPase
MRGLSKQEAIASCEKWGDNRLSEQKKASFWSVFFDNANDPMIKILCIALLVNIVLAVASVLGWIPEDVAWYEPVGIAIAILLATFVSSFSEYSNENAFRRLQEEASRIMCKVWRDGSLVELPIDDIVRGDEILLQTGDKVPADGFVVDGSLKVDQAALNGETQEAVKIPVKEVGYVYDERNIDFLDPFRVFRGAVVVSGNAHVRVAVVGDMSVYGGIATELGQEDDRDTPLKVKLGALAKSISVFGYIGGVAIALSLLFRQVVIANQFDPTLIGAYVANWTRLLNDIINAVMIAVILIVMAVPEGLPLMIAIVSALNMGKMLKDNVLVRKISGIETAGSINFLFADKTGTITKGKLDTIGFYDGQCVEYAEYGDIPPELRRYLGYSLCLNTGAVLPANGQPAIGGNGTERALLNFASAEGDFAFAKVVEQIPFSSINKFSAASIETDVNNVFGKKTWTLIKGAPEKIIDKCACYIEKNGAKTALSSIDNINKTIDLLAGRAIRVIALAICSEKIVGGGDQSFPANAEWALVGIVGIRDDIRPESAGAIAEVVNAGIRVVMITGDRKETAVAIAKEVGLLAAPSDIVLTSDELAALNDDELKEKLPSIKVIARALPADKSRLVRVAQELNFVTGMTGDGVNDSPALKKADVGFAMGGGAEVAKEASEIVIMDDNFSSIDRAILYGRTIFNSIRKFIVFQLTINVSAVLITFIAPFFGQDSPLSITQILWINLIIDTLAALAFGGEPALRRYMSELPKRRDESIVTPGMWSAIITGALWVSALSCVYLFTFMLKSYFVADSGADTFHTGYFAFFVFAAVFNAFNARTEKINLFDNMSGNLGFLRVLGIIVAVQVALVYLGRAVFNCWGLSAKQWLVVISLAITIVPIDMARKYMHTSMREREKKR